MYSWQYSTPAMICWKKRRASSSDNLRRGAQDTVGRAALFLLCAVCVVVWGVVSAGSSSDNLTTLWSTQPFNQKSTSLT